MANWKIFSLFFVVLALLPSMASAYADHSFSATFQLSPDKVHVIEKTTIILETPEERETFSNSLLLGQSTVAQWGKYSSNIKYHVLGKSVILNSTQITARRDFTLSFSAGTIIIEYDVDPSFLVVKQTGSRITNYAVNQSYLLFNRLPTGEIVLGSTSNLIFEIPANARFTAVYPKTDLSDKSRISFLGPLSGKFQIEFQIEKPLSQEVNDYFASSYSNLVNFAPLLLLLALFAFIAYKLLSGN